MTYRRKLIEVALPLQAISAASAPEKSIRHGHPSTLHLWWARKPLAACRAVLFASLVDDPSSDPERFPTAKAQEDERQRLFRIIEDLVLWESTTNEKVLEQARAEIRRSTGGNPPPVLDPFCGGGSIPLEAQRLGLEAHASDLNPVAVLITKALIEIPPRFRDLPPVHPDARRGVGATGTWKGATGLAEDIRRYGGWMRDEAERGIGHLYPKARLPREQGGGEATVIAWLWTRTVRCPNPACGVQMPLLSSLALSTRKGKEVRVEPVVDREAKTVRFAVQMGDGRALGGTVGRQGARCVACASPVSLEHVRTEGRAGRMGAELVAIVVESEHGRIYLPPDEEHVRIARSAEPQWGPGENLATHPQYMGAPRYGLTRFRDLFTPRQLVALTTFSDLVGEARERIRRDAVAAGLPEGSTRLADGGSGAPAYADAVATYLAFALDKGANLWSSITSWMSDRGAFRETFARQAIPMVWDFAEANPFSDSGGNMSLFVERVSDAVAFAPSIGQGLVAQLDAAAAINGLTGLLVSTDPPYYDNVPYADLSDFFYVWLRRSLAGVYPELFGTLLTPKTQELVADVTRFGGRDAASRRFESGLGDAFARIHSAVHPGYPVTVYYAFKQAESDDSGGDGGGAVASTGWETMLEALLGAGFLIDGTWPMRTEGAGRIRALGSNALASSIVLVCRPRLESAGITTRRDFVERLKAELPNAVRLLQHGSIAPVDLAQASIGPGMAVFSRYARVLEPDGKDMRVRTALGLINQVLDEALAEQESEFDPETRWAITWFEQQGMKEGPYGVAEVLAKAKDATVDGLVRAGVLESKAGKVRLLRRPELSKDWDPAADKYMPVWEVTQRLVKALYDDGSESATADLVARVGGFAELARDLAYRLYLVCERKGWADDALAYNALVVAWPSITRLAGSRSAAALAQTTLNLGG